MADLRRQLLQYGNGSKSLSSKRALLSSLHQFEKDLTYHIIDQRGPNNDHKTQITTRRQAVIDPHLLPWPATSPITTPLTDTEISVALRMSEQYNLNEVDCVVYLLITNHKVGLRDKPAEVAFCLAVGVMFETRTSLLQSLLTLLECSVLNKEAYADVAQDLNSCTTRLFSSSAGPSLLRVLLEAMARLGRPDAGGIGSLAVNADPILGCVMSVRGERQRRDRTVQRLRVLMSQCLLYACLVSRISDSDAVLTLQLLLQCQAGYTDASTSQTELFRILYTVMFALVASLVSYAISGADTLAPASAPAAMDGPLLPLFNQELLAALQPSPATEMRGAFSPLAVVAFVWGLSMAATFRDSDTSRQRAAIQQLWEWSRVDAAFRTLHTNILDSPTFQKEGQCLQFVVDFYCHRLLLQFISSPIGHQALQTMKHASSGDSGAMALSSLFSLLGFFYRQDRKCSLADTTAMWTFVHWAGLDHSSLKTGLSFLNMLSHLARNDRLAEKVFLLLQSSTLPQFSLDLFNRSLAKYSAQPAGHHAHSLTSRPATSIPDADLDMLLAYTRCLTSMASCPLPGRTRAWFPRVDPFLTPLSLPGIQPKLKCALRAFLAAWVGAVDPPASAGMWALLAAYDMPVSKPLTNGSPLVRHTLERELARELSLASYGTTISYLALYNSLLQKHPNPPDSGCSCRDMFDFVTGRLCGDLSPQNFSDVGHKWELFSQVFDFFTAVLEQGVEPDSLGTRLMEDLCQGGMALRLLLHVLSVDPPTLREEMEAEEYGAAHGQAVKSAWRLLLLAVERSSRPSSSVSLLTLLSAQPSTLANLLLFVGHHSDPLIQLSSVHLLDRVSKTVPNSASVLSMYLDGIVSAYIDCLRSGFQAVTEVCPLEKEGSHGTALPVPVRILRVFLASLSHPAPFTCLGNAILLTEESSSGYSLTSEASCLSVVLDFLGESQGSRVKCLEAYELGLHLVHDLAVHRESRMADSVLARVLSPRDSFFQSLLSLSPLLTPAPTPPSGDQLADMAAEALSLHQAAWIMELVAIVLHMADLSVHYHREACTAVIHNLIVPGSHEPSSSLQLLQLAQRISHMAPSLPGSRQPPWDASPADIVTILTENHDTSALPSPILLTSEHGDILIDSLAAKALWTSPKDGSQGGLLGFMRSEARPWEEVQGLIEQVNTLAVFKGAQAHAASAWGQLVQTVVPKATTLFPLSAPLLHSVIRVVDFTLDLLTTTAPTCDAKMASSLSQVVAVLCTSLSDFTMAADISTPTISTALPSFLTKAMAALELHCSSPESTVTAIYTALSWMLSVLMLHGDPPPSPPSPSALPAPTLHARTPLASPCLSVLFGSEVDLTRPLVADALHGSLQLSALAYTLLTTLLGLAANLSMDLTLFMDSMVARRLLQTCADQVALLHASSDLFSDGRDCQVSAQLYFLLQVALLPQEAGLPYLKSAAFVENIATGPFLTSLLSLCLSPVPDGPSVGQRRRFQLLNQTLSLLLVVLSLDRRETTMAAVFSAVKQHQKQWRDVVKHCSTATSQEELHSLQSILHILSMGWAKQLSVPGSSELHDTICQLILEYRQVADNAVRSGYAPYRLTRHLVVYLHSAVISRSLKLEFQGNGYQDTLSLEFVAHMLEAAVNEYAAVLSSGKPSTAGEEKDIVFVVERCVEIIVFHIHHLGSLSGEKKLSVDRVSAAKFLRNVLFSVEKVRLQIESARSREWEYGSKLCQLLNAHVASFSRVPLKLIQA